VLLRDSTAGIVYTIRWHEKVDPRSRMALSYR